MIGVIKWDHEAWEDYLYWQATDKKNLKRINQLIKDWIMNNDTIVLMVVLFIITLIILLPVLLEYKRIYKQQCYDLRMKLLSKHDNMTWTDIWKVETSPSSPTINKFLLNRLETLEKELEEVRQELKFLIKNYERNRI